MHCPLIQPTTSQPIADLLPLLQGHIARLIQFGAVYTCPVPPNIPEATVGTLSLEDVAEARARREAAWAAVGNRDTRHSSPQRVLEDTTVAEHAYVRVHLSPKRFPVFHSTHWPSRLIAQLGDFVIINKPPGLPVAPTVDNVLESSLTGAALAVGASEPLLITSRLDQATAGVLVLGRTPVSVRQFNEAMVRGPEGGLRKFYRALVTASPPPDGPIKHYVRVRCRRPGAPYFTLVVHEGAVGAVPCELVVRGSQPVRLNADAVAAFGAEEAHEVFIELVTGRTHQIRAQLSAMGAPLLGDDLYGPLASAELRQVGN